MVWREELSILLVALWGSAGLTTDDVYDEDERCADN